MALQTRSRTGPLDGTLSGVLLLHNPGSPVVRMRQGPSSQWGTVSSPEVYYSWDVVVMEMVFSYSYSHYCFLRFFGLILILNMASNLSVLWDYRWFGLNYCWENQLTTSAHPCMWFWQLHSLLDMNMGVLPLGPNRVWHTNWGRSRSFALASTFPAREKGKI